MKGRLERIELSFSEPQSDVLPLHYNLHNAGYEIRTRMTVSHPRLLRPLCIPFPSNQQRVSNEN